MVALGRSREGAWIEIVAVDNSKVGFWVAPARERGLKYKRFAMALKRPRVAPARERGLKLHINKVILHSKGRSREGAWIEI